MLKSDKSKLVLYHGRRSEAVSKQFEEVTMHSSKKLAAEGPCQRDQMPRFSWQTWLRFDSATHESKEEI